MLDGFGSQFVVPGLVAVDLAQPVPGTVRGQPRGGIGAHVDRLSGHVRGRVRCGDPSRGFGFRTVLSDRLAKKPVLVPRGAPATVEEKLDPVAGSIRGRRAQRLEQVGLKVGQSWIFVIEHRHTVGENAVSSGEETITIATRTWLVVAKESGRRRRDSGGR
jgi:hypothetical protein